MNTENKHPPHPGSVPLGKTGKESSERKDLLALSLENLSEMILVTDLEHRIVYVNPAVRTLLGYGPEEMIGRKAADFFPGISGNPPDLAREMVRNHGPDGTWRGEILNRKKDGSTIDVLLSLSELRDSQDRPLGYVGVTRDITARKKIERELKRANQRLRRLDRQKSDYLSLVSHELRTPLTSLRSFAEILLEDETMAEERRREFLSIIREDTDRLTRLINNVLDLGRIEAGTMRWEEEVFSLADRVDKAIRTLKGLALSRQVSIEPALADDPVLVFADPDRIQQVAINLLSNAVAVSPPGETVRVEVSRVKEDGEIRARVAVTDRGGGIAAADREKIFEKFYRQEKRKRGSGLGLFISREIVHHYGGTIGVAESSPRGTTVSFFIPTTERAG
ncbi:MAG: PAS domain-containing sensor histidine kinase [Candidatus Erginobacter occultus]|nr:PAS domain-containing sensor histidine kinase [Candidatus Erginobacter occultus]